MDWGSRSAGATIFARGKLVKRIECGAERSKDTQRMGDQERETERKLKTHREKSTQREVSKDV